MKKILIVALLSMGLLGLSGSWTVSSADDSQSDFALLDTTDTNVACGARRGDLSGPAKPTAFEIYITMSNFGADGFVRVTYEDGDSVDYQIATGETLNINLSAGGTPGADQLIVVEESGGADLRGQISILTHRKSKPHPSITADLPAPVLGSLCVTDLGGV